MTRTDDTREPFAPELLLQHAAGLRGLVRRLVGDDHRADDILQETYLRAVEAPPRHGTAIGAWLRTVATRLALRSRRREDTRRRHESRAPRDDTVPSAEEIVERERARRELVDVVMELDEPYRTTVLYRYFENLTSREVAEQLGVPLETVRTRLKRGVARLRERLDDRHDGDRRTWQRALVLVAGLPLPEAAAAASAAAAGSAAGTTTSTAPWTTWVAAVGVTLIAAGTAFTAWSALTGEADVSPATTGPAGTTRVEAAAAGADSRPGEPAPLGIRRVEAPIGDDAATRPDAPVLELSSRIVDAAGSGIVDASVTIVLRDRETRDDRRRPPSAARKPTPTTVRTDAHGGFAVVLPAHRETSIALHVRDGRHAPRVVHASWHVGQGAARLEPIALANAARITGRIVATGHGRAIPGAVVTARPRDPALREAGRLVDAATAATDGRFTVLGLPAGDFDLQIRHADHAPRSLRVADLGIGEHRLLADTVVSPGIRLEGVVVDANGRGIADATVGAISSACRDVLEQQTGDDGSFRVTVGSDDPVALLVVHPEFAPRAWFRDDAVESDLRIRLEAKRRLTGRIVTADSSRGVGGVTVRARSIARGRGRERGSRSFPPRDPRASWRRYGPGDRRGSGRTPVTVTAPDGTFELAVATGGTWQLVIDAGVDSVVQRRDIDLSTAPTTNAGEIALLDGVRVRGSVVTASAPTSPIADATIRVRRPDDALEPLRQSTSLRSAADGSFALPALPVGTRVELEIRSSAGHAIHSTTVRVTESPEPLVLALRDGATVRGRVRGLLPHERAVVVARDGTGRRHTTAVAPPSHRYELSGLSPDRDLELWVERDPDETRERVTGPRAALAAADLDADRPSVRDLDAGSLTRLDLTGRVRAVGIDPGHLVVLFRAQSTPGSNADRDRGRGRDRNDIIARPATDGSFRVRGLRAGPYRVDVVAAEPGRRPSPRSLSRSTITITVDGDATPTLSLDVVAARVTAAALGGRSDAPIDLLPADDDRRIGVVTADHPALLAPGSYRFRGRDVDNSTSGVIRISTTGEVVVEHR